MTDSSESTAVQDKLRARARRLGRLESDDQDRHLELTMAVVAVGRERLGLPVTGVREISKAPHVAPLPGLPPWILGITHVRGEIISVVHLGRLFEIEEAGAGKEVAIIDDGGRCLGLLVDSLLELREVYADDIAERFEELISDKGRPLHAMTKDLVAILDLGRLIEDERLRTGKDTGGQKLEQAHLDEAALNSDTT